MIVGIGKNNCAQIENELIKSLSKWIQNPTTSNAFPLSQLHTLYSVYTSSKCTLCPAGYQGDTVLHQLLITLLRHGLKLMVG